MGKSPLISIVIPVFNEETNVVPLYATLVALCKDFDIRYELIFVDDGSSDGTVVKIQEIISTDTGVRLLCFSRNFGQQAAFSAGLAVAVGDATVMMDADFQDPPELLTQFIVKWREGADIVYGVRQNRKEGILQRLCYSTFYRMLRLLGEIDIPLDAGDFSLMDRRVVDTLVIDCEERCRFLRGLRAFTGFRSIGVPYDRPERGSGETKYTLRKLLKLAGDGLIDFSNIPLRFATVAGVIVAMGSFAFAIFFILHRLLDFKILGSSPLSNPGIATAVVGLFGLSGLILCVLGIIGEYLGRIYQEVKQRPVFVVNDFLNVDAKALERLSYRPRSVPFDKLASPSS